MMKASIVEESGSKVKLQIEIELKGTMLDMEYSIQQGVNELGNLATTKALKKFDTDGTNIKIGEITLTSKGQVSQTYQTPYGEVPVDRHLYQSSSGGQTFCPLEKDGRIILTSTPKFAKIVSSKYVEQGATKVERDLSENNSRVISRSYIKNLGDFVGALAQSKEEKWEYELPHLEKKVSTISISVDGTCMLLCDEGWREAMTGAISLYDIEGKRLHTIYSGATPEYGKAKFKERFDREVMRLKVKYGEVLYIGLADGAKDNWPYLKEHTDMQVIDFWHASEYVVKASNAIYPRKKDKAICEEWVERNLHNLKHENGGAKKLIKEMEEKAKDVKMETRKEKLESSIRYFKNNYTRMNYSNCVKENLPIGSGVCEAACKTLIKERLCSSGMRWKEDGASAIITLRAIHMTGNRWGQFWEKIDQYGIAA